MDPDDTMRLCTPQRDGITRTVRVDPALTNVVQNHITRSKHIRRKRPSMDVRLNRKLHKYELQLDVTRWRILDAQKKVDSITAFGVKIEAKKEALMTQMNANRIVFEHNQNRGMMRGNDNPPGGQQGPAPNQVNNNPNPNAPQIGNNVNNNANNVNLPSNQNSASRSGSQQHRQRIGGNSGGNQNL